MERFGHLAEEYAHLAHGDPIDHRLAVAQQIHPVLHLHATEKTAATNLQCVPPVERVAECVTDCRTDHVVREGFVPMLVDAPDAPDTMLCVAVVERQVLRDDDLGATPFTAQRSGNSTPRLAGTRLDDAPRSYGSFEESLGLESRRGALEVRGSKGAATDQKQR